jgi:hypothetical protein
MKIILMIWLTALLTCSSVHAGNFFAGGGFGVATGGEDAGSLNQKLEDVGLQPGASTNGDIRMAWQAYITYQFLPKWGLEIAYIDLGEATISFEGIDEDIDDILDRIGDNHPRSAQGIKLSATYRYELNKSLQLQGKLGWFDWETSYTFSGVKDNGDLVTRDVNLSSTDVSFGLGLVHKLTNNISAHLEWDFYPIENAVVNLFTFGASYKFY